MRAKAEGKDVGDLAAFMIWESGQHPVEGLECPTHIAVNAKVVNEHHQGEGR